MAIVRWDPVKDLLSLQQEMGRLFDRTFSAEGKSPLGWAAGTWAPAIDMYENDSELVVTAELPGLSAKDIDISLKDNILTLKGEKKFSEEVKEENYYRVERRYGSFQRLIDLPTTVKKDKIKASFREGVLKVTLPKVEAERPKEIKVQVEEGK